MHLRFKGYFTDRGLKAAPKILNRNLRGGLTAIGKRLVTSSKSRMRRDTGTQIKELQMKVQGKALNLNVIVYSELIQSFIDAYGLRRGVFPDFGVNSRLYEWARRHAFKDKSIGAYRLRRAGEKPGGSKKVKFPTEGKKRRPFGKRRKRKVKEVRPITRVGENVGKVNLSKRTRAKNTSSRRLAFLVARAIFEKGIKPTHWNTRALQANRKSIINEIGNSLRRSANEMRRQSTRD